MNESFQSKTPHSDLLKKHIAYYYFHQSGIDSVAKSFVYYPHYKNALTIYKDSVFRAENTYHTITSPQQNGYVFGFAKLINHAAKAEILPPFNKIGIVFQPIGLNHFLTGDLATYINEPIRLDFNYFKPSILPVLDEVYQTTSMDKKVQLLDAYFLTQLSDFYEPKLEAAIDIILKTGSKITVNELANQLNINRKMLHRLFRKHQNCSVIDYIKLIQFRKSIEVFNNSYKRGSFTELALQTEYYDQSDFIHHFKKLTGFNPTYFFKNLSSIGDQGTYWTFD